MVELQISRKANVGKAGCRVVSVCRLMCPPNGLPNQVATKFLLALRPLLSLKSYYGIIDWCK
jgi:hypothetical protein